MEIQLNYKSVNSNKSDERTEQGSYEGSNIQERHMTSDGQSPYAPNKGVKEKSP